MGHAAAANAERRKHPPAGNGRAPSPEGEMRATEFGQKPGFPRLEIPVFGRRKGTEAAPQADSQRQYVHRAACAWGLLVFVFGSVAVNHGKEGGLLFLRHPGNGKGIEKSRNDSFFFVQFFLCATVQSIFYKSSGNCLRIRLCMGSRIRSASPAEKIY